MKIDGHVHSNFCPHGTTAPMEDYVLRAIDKGLDKLTFTEHAPLPEGFTDPVPEKDSAMLSSDVAAYLKEGQRLAEKYSGTIEIRTGFEVDFIEGFEKETEAFLETVPEAVPHSILSVHFIKLSDGYFCIDYSADAFEKKAEDEGTVALYKAYERTLRQAAGRPFGELTPPVIGHINLIHKFWKRVPAQDKTDWSGILKIVAANGYTLDHNFAGIDKPEYGEPYPNKALLEIARMLNIPLQTGSDAHHPDDVGRYFTSL